MGINSRDSSFAIVNRKGYNCASPKRNRARARNNEDPMHIETNYELAKVVFGILLEARKQRRYPYDRPALPQLRIPPEVRANPLLHRRLLKFACNWMRGAIRSDYAIKQTIALYFEWPELLDPRIAKAMDPADIAPVLERKINYHTVQIAGIIVENARRLDEVWDGDPRNIFLGVTDPDEARRRLIGKKKQQNDPREQGFIGYQEKMASMEPYFLMDADLIDYLPISPPVDFQNLRTLMATEIIRVLTEKPFRYTRKLVLAVIYLLERYLIETGVHSRDLADAMWLLSKTVCSSAPGNSSVNISDNPEKKIYIPLELDWTKPNLVRRYERSCGVCPVGNHCRRHVFASSYYVHGEFRQRPHESPPQRALLGPVPRLMRPEKPRGEKPAPKPHNASGQMSLFPDLEAAE